METIAIAFPARRYHATPWDAHVNEGRIEWPPSPWRLLRALLAVGYSKLGWVNGPDEASQSALDKLAKVLPTYSIPPGTVAHSRHYMPTRDKTSKVFDAFIRFNEPDAQLLVHYGVDLNEAERNALGSMVEGLSYLGRAESWADATLLPPSVGNDAGPSAENCQPYGWSTSNNPVDGTRVRLLASMPYERFESWRSEQIELSAEALEKEEITKQAAKGKSPSAAALRKVRNKATTRFPADLLAALQSDTSTWQGQGWPQPPGSEWVDYHLPASAIQHLPLTPLGIKVTSDRTAAVLLAIDGDGKRGTVRPLITRALPLMETLHAEAVRKALADLGFGNLPEITGRSDDGSVLRGHRHAHWLPLSLFGDGRIDHVLVHCRDGFTPQAVAALAAIRWGYSKGIDRLSINLAGMGNLAQIEQQLRRTPLCRPKGLRALQIASRWESITPLVLSKFAQRHGKKTPERQVREELIQRGFDDPISVTFWTAEEMVRRRLKGYVLARRAGKPQPPMQRSLAVTLEFERPQTGPIHLGYASHFGLGLMGACTQRDGTR
jgi:CRISPR-associated protein Csb2